MQEIYGHCNGPVVILHGGAASQDQQGPRHGEATGALRRIAEAATAGMAQGRSALDTVVFCLQEMEKDPRFNAGFGSALQADGQVRVTAALMDGPRQVFSGVLSVQHVTHPSLIARHLQNSDSRVVTNPGAELLARELGLPVESQITPERLARWVKAREAGKSQGFDTVGCVVRTAAGELYAGTSTGGRGFEFPGRVSDAATVAGTYASAHAAISATGTGEQIVDDALCARLETRCRDGLSLEESSKRCFREAQARGHDYGWIAVSQNGDWGLAHTTPAMTWVVAAGGEIIRTS
jgi:L-asparaginase